MKKILCMALACVLCTSLALADGRTLQSVEAGRLIQPAAIQKIDIDLNPLSPWITPGGISQAAGPLIYDCVEVPNLQPGLMTDGVSGGGYDPVCFDADANGTSDSPTSRYYFGESYCNPQFVSDMTMDDGDGGLYGTHQFCWFWYVNGAGTAEPMFALCFMYDDFDDTGAGPPASGGHDGYQVQFVGDTDYDGDGTFDDVFSGSGGGYFYAIIDVTNLGGIELPLDLQGAFHMIFAQDIQPTVIILATCAQPMLWGHKPAAPGYSNDLQWDEDVTCIAGTTACTLDCTLGPDGSFSAPCELYSYGGACVFTILNGTSAFWLSDACAGFKCADLNCDGSVNNADIPPFVQALTDLAGWQATYPDCDISCVGDTDANGSFNNGDIPGFVFALTNGGLCPWEVAP